MTHHSNGLSVSIIARSSVLWRWQLDVVQALLEQPEIRLARLITLDQSVAQLPRAISALHRLDALVFRSPMPAFEAVELSLLGKVSTLSEYQAATSGSEISDVVIDFTEQSNAGKLLSMARLGVLSAHFSDAGLPTSWRLGLSEYCENSGQTYLAVTMFSESGRNIVLSEARPSLDQGSYTRNLNYYYLLMTKLWLRAFKQLLQDSAEQSLSDNNELSAVASESPVTAMLQASAYRRFGANLLAKLQQKFLSKEQWRILIRFNRCVEPEQSLPLAFGEYHELIPPADCFWADPFVITHNARHYVFFEELPFATERGHLCCMEVFTDGSHSAPVIILQQDYHLSYPNVFEYESIFYMIPESGDNGTIDLYRCTSFPYEWTFSQTLLSGFSGYDSTLLEHNGRWWLFVTVAIEAGCSGCEELHLFYADSPTSQVWQSHSQSPVMSDAAKARPAGQFFNWKGQIYRPSQDCAGSYGAGLNINRVINLDPHNYQEVTEQVCRPDWDPDLIALHTLNFNPQVAVADALRKHSRYHPK